MIKKSLLVFLKHLQIGKKLGDVGMRQTSYRFQTWSSYLNSEIIFAKVAFEHKVRSILSFLK